VACALLEVELGPLIPVVCALAKTVRRQGGGIASSLQLLQT
jgi:hypothetical protein